MKSINICAIFPEEGFLKLNLKPQAFVHSCYETACLSMKVASGFERLLLLFSFCQSRHGTLSTMGLLSMLTSTDWLSLSGVRVAPILIWLEEFVCSLTGHRCIFLLCGQNQRLESCMFLCVFSRTRNNAVLTHKLWWIPWLCWSSEQVTSHSSARCKLWITSVLLLSISYILSSSLKNTHLGLHLLCLSMLYTARVYESYFTGIAVCIYSQCNLLLQHLIKRNKYEQWKKILWQILSYQKIR